MANEPSKIEFHPSARERFDGLAQIALNNVRSFPIFEPTKTDLPVQPVFTVNPQDIIGEVNFEQRLVNLAGDQTGHFWESKGQRFGWEGAEYKEIKQLILRFEKAVEERVSFQFLHTLVFRWLREKLELKRNDGLSDYITDQCSKVIKDYEIWIPIYRTYSTVDFTVGSVEFRIMSKAVLDRWFDRLAPDKKSESNSWDVVNRERANLLGSIAGCVRVNAEREKAREIAHTKVNQAVGLLRFITHVNLTCKLVSHCAPVGKENTQQVMDFLFEDGEIRGSTRAWIEQGPIEWSVDEARGALPGALESLQKLAVDSNGTEFKRVLFHALQLHSRHSIATEIPNKIVFVTASIESLLLKDSSEPIQKNLGERMAFIIGQNFPERKEIIRNVDAFYRLRSELFHHGRDIGPDDTEVIDRFFTNVWICFSQLLNCIDMYKAKAELIAALEKRKLS